MEPPLDPGLLAQLGDLAEIESRRWKTMLNGLTQDGTPTALKGGFAGLEYDPPPVALAPVTLGATELAVWPTTWTPIAANPTAPKAYRLLAICTVTTTATASPTMTLTPRIGTSNVGATLGADAQITLTASITSAPLIIRGDVIVRAGGTSATAFGSFQLAGKFAAAANGVVGQHDIFGFTAATFDSTAAQALWLGVTSTITTPTITPQGVIWASWN